MPRRVNSRVPVLSADTVHYVETEIAAYQDIVYSGGWPVVPSSKKLRLGVDDPSVATLRKRLIISGDLAKSAGTSTAFDTYVDGAVKRFQARHGLPVDGVLGRYSYAALNVSAAVRLGQLETNLVRLRSMSGYLGDRYVMVNIPAAQIEAVEGQKVVLRHTAIVGKISRQTPILNSKIHEVILNPYWTAPRSIIEKDIMPLMRKDPTYLTRNAIRLFDGKGNEVDPQTIDWNAAEAPKLMFRQDPGKINAMSSTKINFHNPHAVYMHDTPQQSLFGKVAAFRELRLRARPKRPRSFDLAAARYGRLGQPDHGAGDRQRRQHADRTCRTGAGLFHLYHRLVDGRWRRAVPRRHLPQRRCRGTGAAVARNPRRTGRSGVFAANSVD